MKYVDIRFRPLTGIIFSSSLQHSFVHLGGSVPYRG